MTSWSLEASTSSLFAMQSNMADYNNVLSTIIQETTDQHLPPLEKRKQKKSVGTLKSAYKSSTKLFRVFEEADSWLPNNLKQIAIC